MKTLKKTTPPHHLYVKEGERPTVKSLFESLGGGDTLHIGYEPKLLGGNTAGVFSAERDSESRWR